MTRFSKRTILTKTFQISLCTILSRLFGIVRESLIVRYLGADMLNDAFITAFKIPNGLRKIFAEGAMSAAFVPSLSTLINERGRASANGLMSLSFLIFEGFVILLCIAAMVCAPAIITLAAPGFKFEAVAIVHDVFLF